MNVARMRDMSCDDGDADGEMRANKMHSCTKHLRGSNSTGYTVHAHRNSIVTDSICG